MKTELLDRLLARARSVPRSDQADESLGLAPGAARALVLRWLEQVDRELSENWLVVSRRGLAVALGLMLVSVAWHAHALRAPVSMEWTASETVILSVYP